MSGVRQLPAMAVILLFLAVTSPATAGAFELTGAWASQADLCKSVFTKKGNQVVFAEFSDLFGSGFIVDGNQMRGRTAKCTIKSRKQDGDNLELVAACSTSIMNQSVNFNLKVIDDNNLSRFFPGMEGMTLKYSRCTL